jgi:adenine-specific DNA-methyltransferase
VRRPFSSRRRHAILKIHVSENTPADAQRTTAERTLHPMTVRLTWDGQFDAEGKRVGPVRIALPFQTIETVNESGAVRAHQLSLFTHGKPSEWRNRLIWGDKKYVLPSLLPEFEGKINLIYIDPPFATGADFSFTTTIPDADATLEKAPSLIEQKAYCDTWGRGLDGYLQ